MASNTVLLTLLGLTLTSPASANAPARIVEGARRQLVEPARYDPSYRRLSYPNGDVPADVGVCTDVVIRALRHAGYDLQRLIHEDMRRGAFRTYPRRGRAPDRNIDHRRVPNQAHFFRRFGRSLPLDPARFQPGEIVAWKLPNGLDHVGVVSDRRGPSCYWMVIHNISRTAEEDVLNRWRIVGRYRYP